MANGLVFSILGWNSHTDADPKPMRDFISVSSSLYPDLAPYYDEAIARYLDEFLTKDDSEGEAA